MKLEEIEKYLSYTNDDPHISMHKKYVIYEAIMPKLLAVAKAVSVHIDVWQKFAKMNRSTKDLLGTRFDPAYKSEQELGLKEVFEELEKE